MAGGFLLSVRFSFTLPVLYTAGRVASDTRAVRFTMGFKIELYFPLVLMLALVAGAILGILYSISSCDHRSESGSWWARWAWRAAGGPRQAFQSFRTSSTRAAARGASYFTPHGAPELNHGAQLYSAPASLCESLSRQTHPPPASALPPRKVAGRRSAPSSARAV